MNVFRSFIMGGYECGDYINSHGEKTNLLHETEHDVRAEDDYRELAEMDIKTVKEGICWNTVETLPYVFDFIEVRSRIEAAGRNGLQLIWEINHSYPDGLTAAHPEYIERFTALCKAFALLHREAASQPLLFIPYSNLSYTDEESQNAFYKAVITAVKAVKQIDPECRIIAVDNTYSLQAVLCGIQNAEFGGREDLLDIVGIIHYPEGTQEALKGFSASKRPAPRQTLSKHLNEAYKRFNKPVVIAATGSWGDARAEWIEAMTEECVDALNQGVELAGMCIVPVLDKPEHTGSYSNFGIWNLDTNKNRIPHLPVVNAIFDSQRVISYCLNNGAAAEAEREIAEITQAFAKFKSIDHESI